MYCTSSSNCCFIYRKRRRSRRSLLSSNRMHELRNRNFSNDIVALNIGLPRLSSHSSVTHSPLERYTPAKSSKPIYARNVCKSMFFHLTPYFRLPYRLVISRTIFSIGLRNNRNADTGFEMFEAAKAVGPILQKCVQCIYYSICIQRKKY